MIIKIAAFLVIFFGAALVVLQALYNRWVEQSLRELSAALSKLHHSFGAVVDRCDRDALTGVWSRGAGERRAMEALRVFPCVVIWLDVDDFGQVNKTLGWGVGDALLRDLGDRLSRYFRRAHDTVYRGGTGSDEFVVVLPAIPLHNDYLPPEGEVPDPLSQVESWAQQSMRAISEEAKANFTYAITHTRVFPRDALFQAQEEVRRAKIRRDDLRRAASEIESDAVVHEVNT